VRAEFSCSAPVHARSTGASNIVDTGRQVWMNHLLDAPQRQARSFRRVTAFLSYADDCFVVLARLALHLLMMTLGKAPAPARSMYIPRHDRRTEPLRYFAAVCTRGTQCCTVYCTGERTRTGQAVRSSQQWPCYEYPGMLH
jgi:hypothetical protein